VFERSPLRIVATIAAWTFGALWFTYHVLGFLAGFSLSYAPLLIAAIPFYVLLVRGSKGHSLLHLQRLALAAAVLGLIDFYMMVVDPSLHNIPWNSG